MNGVTSVMYTCCVFVLMLLSNDVQCQLTSDCRNASSSSIRCRPNPCQDGINGVLHMKTGEHIRCESSHSGEGIWQCPNYRISDNDLTIPSDFPLNTQISCIYLTELNEESRNITLLVYDDSRSVNTKAPQITGEVSGGSLDTATIAGIVIGIVALVLLIIFIVCCICKKWHQKVRKKLRCSKTKKDKDKSIKYKTDKTSTNATKLIEIDNKDSATQKLPDARAQTQTASAALMAGKVEESTSSHHGSSVDGAEELQKENYPMIDESNTSSDSTKSSEQAALSTSQNRRDKVWNPSQHSVVPVAQPVGTEVEAAIQADNDITAIKPDTTLINSRAKSGESHHEEDQED